MYYSKIKIIIQYIKVTTFVCLLLPFFIYCLSEVTFFYLIYLNYFLLSNFCMCSNASHHVYVRSCFKYLPAGGGQHRRGRIGRGGGGTGEEGPTGALCTRFTLVILKITTISIWIILKNLVWTYRECKFVNIKPLDCAFTLMESSKMENLEVKKNLVALKNVKRFEGDGKWKTPKP
jgi:hypothetical protein